MRPEQKQKVRSLISTIPQMMKASLINQAFETRNVIASTFEFSDEFKGQMRNIPPHYIEITQKAYSELLFKAFEGGYKNAQHKAIDELKGLEGDALCAAIKAKLPMPEVFAQDLVALFQSKVAEMFKSTPASESMYIQFKKDLEKAYCEGIEELLKTLPRQDPIKKEELKQEIAQEIVKQEQPVEVAKEETKVQAAAFNSFVKTLEDYTKLIGTEEAENVLRHTLGLPPKNVVKASTTMVGPYDVQVLSEKIKNLVKTHDLTDEELQYVVIDCLVSELVSLEPTALAKILVDKLGLASLKDKADLSLDDVIAASDVMAASLTDAIGLCGELVFMELENEYCLVFAFNRKDIVEVGKESGSLVMAAKKEVSKLPDGPQGVISMQDQEELKALSEVDKSKSKNLKDIKKASAKVFELISQALHQIRYSKVDIAEGCKMLKASMEELVEQAYGKDGLAFFKQVKGK